MFRFEHPGFLWAFAIVPVVFALFLLSQWFSKRAGERFSTRSALARLLGDWSRTKSLVRSVLLFGALAFFCMALANPQWGVRREKVKAKAADIFIALDISNSMYAQDIAPSRLERAKKFAVDLVQALRGNRIGLILFAGNAYLQMPLTTDYAAATLFIKSANPGLASTQGTAIGDAIDLAMRAYLDDEGRNKGLVLITDGENFEDGAIASMKRAHDNGLVPFIVSVGTAEGAFIPMVIQGKQDYKRDENGTPVRTRVNEAFLKELAESGGGYVYNILDPDFVIRDMREKIDQFEKRDMEQRAFKDFNSYYQYFLLAGLLFLLVSFNLSERRRTPISLMPEQTT